MIKINTPSLPESVADATIGVWHCKEGDLVQTGQNLADLETDKVAMELPAPKAGKIVKILVAQGATVKSGDPLLELDDSVAVAPIAPSPSPKAASVTPPPSAPPLINNTTEKSNQPVKLNPSAKKLMEQEGVSRQEIAKEASGRVTKEMVSSIISMRGDVKREETRAPLSRIRLRIAERLLQAQQGAAILTTFNEVNLKQVSELRKKAQDKFEKAHGVKLGFMSFFVRASCIALSDFPQVNASIDGTDMVIRNYMDISIAVSSPRGLVVPVLKNAQALSLAEIEMAIASFAARAKDGSLTIEDMTGGTFSITNGGVFGSLLSTPIINPPQSAILGMHKIMDRPIVEDNTIVIRPMMNLALSYDHRIIDGKEAVSFLVRIKDLLENPALLLMGL
ncbi:MAG: 2-oxoglutarate dehydrogenase complex dihydrolipoyllysine-residue succinyltransferase [Methylacidiphilales bacterium]|nr:2-oxoglutarate dehydrogenase complex dihydrolipoyllysine-residue succinyltransferase [Candidatus Methylacidiphilales bacterium]